MTGPCLMINYFVSRFSNNSSFNDASFVVSYTDKVKNSPLPDPTVSVGVKSFTDQRVSPVYAEDDTTLLYNRIAKTRMCFNIYVPVRTKGLTAFDIFFRMCKYLMEEEKSFVVKGVGCTEIKFSRDEGALLLETWADVEETCIEQEENTVAE
ncbi:MAG: hypothetical protein IJ944_03550 [Clostridia bacterium]|nr:hypothetical protein [Clostridia bacterium]